MPRAYNAQQTIEKIIEAAGRLFLEKGFDKTSMLEIAQAADISKGAIYHHFASKEEIIDAVARHQTKVKEALFQEWLSEMASLTGKEKIIGILRNSLTIHASHQFDHIAAIRMKSPDFVLSYMQELVNQDSALISDLIKEGIADGSLQTEYPDEAAEVFLLLLNIWCDPCVFSGSPAKLETRLRFVQKTMRVHGLDVLSDDLLQTILDVLQQLYPDGDLWCGNNRGEKS
ncbi:TetR/AcrR family transcriptional regulator [Paenibacillus senegalensis]|uniref:TetR/AcrR family transcriptional regulator n=1 Tax=Paenibacillus senegalensis TaxID=1465766 RepID=UPI000287BF4C|nr:TetR/AcrR family transcriptional regulator [Paenibacillus senegalensis]